MYTAKASLLLVALVAGVALVQAAGGIKGVARLDGAQAQRGLDGYKGPIRPQVQQPQLPAPQYQPQPQQQLQPVFQPQQQQQFRPAPLPVKGPSALAPTFSAKRPEQPIQQQQVQPSFVPQQQQQEPEPQQQQQEAEIDPNAAAQEGSGTALALPAGAPSASEEEEANPRPEPYNFNYSFEAGDSATSGSSIREEQQDASGKVTGFYTLKGEDGRDRRVDYIADVNGFRATVNTNEMGTAPKNSADVEWQAQSPSDAQLRAAESATQLARQRALSNLQSLASTSSGSFSPAASNKISSPRQNVAVATSATQQPRELSQLQEPFELNGRARKSRHAPFYLFAI